MVAPFSVLEPPGEETPVVVEIPHAGLAVDALTFAHLAAPARAIAKDADLYVDELYADAPAVGASCLVSHVSRYVVDLNRSEADVDAESVEGAEETPRASRGVIWRLTGLNGPSLDGPLPRSELERRLAMFYRPYHRALLELVQRKVARFGYAIVLAGHSMPSTSPDPRIPRADVVPGTRGRTSASAKIIDAVDAFARSRGYTVAHDEPYRGGFTTQHYGVPSRHVHVVQIELSRRLYMSEKTFARIDASFAKTRAFCRDVVELLGRTKP